MHFLKITVGGFAELELETWGKLLRVFSFKGVLSSSSPLSILFPPVCSLISYWDDFLSGTQNLELSSDSAQYFQL